MNNSQRLMISRQSSRAPGLPHLPSLPRGVTNRVSISSINYDYLPMALESPKVLWVSLTVPAPRDLQVGTPCKLFLSPRAGIQTQLQRFNHANSVFQVGDIIGTRIILLPYKGSTWLPTVHSACDNDYGWGYNLRRINVGTNMHRTDYGYGDSQSFLEYYSQ